MTSPKFQDRDITYIDLTGGFSIEIEEQIFSMIYRSDRGWVESRMPLSEVRGFSSTTVTPEKYTFFRSGRQGSTSAAIGDLSTMAKNAQAKNQAAYETGVTFALRSVKHPEFHVSIPVDTIRKQVDEALTQAIIENRSSVSFHHISSKALSDMKRRQTKDAKRPPSRFKKIIRISLFILLGVAAFFALLALNLSLN